MAHRVRRDGKYLIVETDLDRYDDAPPIRKVRRGEEYGMCKVCGKEEDVCDLITELGEIERLYGTITGETRYCNSCHEKEFPEKHNIFRLVDGDLDGVVKVLEHSPRGTRKFTAVALSDLCI